MKPETMPHLSTSRSIAGLAHKTGAVLTGLIVLLMLLGVAAKCRAGITVGDRPPGMSESQFYQMAVEGAEKDLERKKAVGQRRYDQKMAYRESVINGMRSQLELRRAMITVVPAPALIASSRKKTDYLGYGIWTLAIAVTGLAAWQFWLGRRQARPVEG